MTVFFCLMDKKGKDVKKYAVIRSSSHPDLSIEQ